MRPGVVTAGSNPSRADMGRGAHLVREEGGGSGEE